ncbi:MAG: ECF-type sigma factor [Acidobacteriota bacterium]
MAEWVHSTLRKGEGKTVMAADFFSSDDSRANLDYQFSIAYEELRRLAFTVRHSDPGATLSPTTLVNEAWLKLSKGGGVEWESALHFKRTAACAMRQVLITAARKRNAGKRSAGGVRVPLDDSMDLADSTDDQLLALDDALEELARMNPRQAAMVESRFFGGLEISEIATLLGVSEATILRDWRVARAWLAQRLEARQPGSGDGR